MNKAAFILVLLTMLFSCKKHRLKNEKEILEGKWEWVYSIEKGSYLSPPFPTWIDTVFPSDLSSSYGITFLKKGKVQLFENNELKDEHRTVFTDFNNETGTSCLFNSNPLIYNNPYIFEIDLDNVWNHSMRGCVNSDTLVLTRCSFPIPDSAYGSSSTFYISFFKKVN